MPPKQTSWPMEQNRKPKWVRSNSHLIVHNDKQTNKENNIRKPKINLQHLKMMVGKLGVHMPKNASGPSIINIQKNQLQIDQRPQCETWNTELLEENTGNAHKTQGRKFLNRTSFAQALRPTIEKWDLVKLKRFCTTKETTK